MLSVNGDGFAHGLPIIAFSDGTPGPMMCYGDDQDEGRDGVRVCIVPSDVPTPFEIHVGDALYRVKLPGSPDPPVCVAEPADVEAGSRLSGDITRVVTRFLFFSGGVVQYVNGTFIPLASALPPGAPFLETRQRTFQGVHGTPYPDSIEWLITRIAILTQP